MSRTDLVVWDNTEPEIEHHQCPDCSDDSNTDCGGLNVLIVYNNWKLKNDIDNVHADGEVDGEHQHHHHHHRHPQQQQHELKHDEGQDQLGFICIVNISINGWLQLSYHRRLQQTQSHRVWRGPRWWQSSPPPRSSRSCPHQWSSCTTRSRCCPPWCTPRVHPCQLQSETHIKLFPGQDSDCVHQPDRNLHCQFLVHSKRSVR